MALSLFWGSRGRCCFLASSSVMVRKWSVLSAVCGYERILCMVLVRLCLQSVWSIVLYLWWFHGGPMLVVGGL